MNRTVIFNPVQVFLVVGFFLDFEFFGLLGFFNDFFLVIFSFGYWFGIFLGFIC